MTTAGCNGIRGQQTNPIPHTGADTFHWIQLLRDALLLFPVTNLSIVCVSFLVGSSISPFHPTLSIPLCLFLAHRWQSKKAHRTFLVASFLFVLLFAAAVLVSVLMVDAGHDSRSYHGPAVIALSDGWNPLHERHVCRWDEAHCTPTNKLIDHYPKGQWYIAAGLYSFSGNIEAGKSLNLLMLILCFIVSYELVVKVLQGRRVVSLISAIAMTANPVAVAQLFSGYLDGLLASVFTIYAILLIDYLIYSQKKRLYQAALILPYLINIKFTGLVYSAVFTSLFVLVFVLWRRKFPHLLVLNTLIATAFSVAAIGVNPYVINLLEKKNLFFPAYQPGVNVDIIRNQASSDFMKRNRFEKFVIANFSVSDENDHQIPVPVMPFTRFESSPKVDQRFSGFGSLFSGILIIAILQSLWPREKIYTVLVLTVIATVFSTSACWWARLAPQTWLAVCLIELGAVAAAKNAWGRKLAQAMMVVMILNSSLVLARVAYRQGQNSARFYKHIGIVRMEGRAVQIVENRYGLFGFYNRRKVIDSLGEDARIVGGCESERRNRIFRICKPE